jgi:hypothetical protein
MVDLESRYLRNLKKIGEVFSKIIFSFPGGFFYSMVVPQDFVHLEVLPPSDSLFGIKNLDRSFSIR